MEKGIVVFCGSSHGNNETYGKVAFEVGQLLSKLGITLVYGGAQVGLMGKVADGCLSTQGKAIGIIPTYLKRKEIVHDGLTELIETDTMHERKRLMSDMSRGSITLPGGYGTLEELFEFVTAAQLNQYNHPIILMNVEGYYDDLIKTIQNMSKAGLIRESNLSLITIIETVDELKLILESL